MQAVVYPENGRIDKSRTVWRATQPQTISIDSQRNSNFGTLPIVRRYITPVARDFSPSGRPEKASELDQPDPRILFKLKKDFGQMASATGVPLLSKCMIPVE